LDELASYIQNQLGGTVNVTKDASGSRLVFSTGGADRLIFKKGPRMDWKSWDLPQMTTGATGYL